MILKLIYTNMIIIMPSWMMHETIMMNDDYISMPLYFYKKNDKMLINY